MAFKVNNDALAGTLEHFVFVHSEDIHHAIEDYAGLNLMFQGFLQSEAFTTLDQEQRGKAFTTYQGLYGYLDSLNDLLYEHDMIS